MVIFHSFFYVYQRVSLTINSSDVDQLGADFTEYIQTVASKYPSLMGPNDFMKSRPACCCCCFPLLLLLFPIVVVVSHYCCCCCFPLLLLLFPIVVVVSHCCCCFPLLLLFPIIVVGSYYCCCILLLLLCPIISPLSSLYHNCCILLITYAVDVNVNCWSWISWQLCHNSFGAKRTSLFCYTQVGKLASLILWFA